MSLLLLVLLFDIAWAVYYFCCGIINSVVYLAFICR